MSVTTSFRKIASVLLVLCLFLPLSKCEAKKAPPGQAESADTIFYGYEFAVDAIHDVENGMVLHAIAPLLVVFNAFLIPVFCLKFGEKIEVIVTTLGFLPAMYFLHGCVFQLGAKIQYGGVLAFGCWFALLAMNASFMWQRIAIRRTRIG